MNKTKKIIAMLMLVVMLGVTLISTNTYAATSKKGDVNGDGKINVADINIIAAYLKKKTTLSDEMKKIADFNGDGKVTTEDINLIAEFIKGQVGDMNGDKIINAKDINIIAAHIAGKRTLSAEMLKIADVDKSGKVTKADITLISARIKGQINFFPRKGDIDANGKVNSRDFIILQAAIQGKKKFKYDFYGALADMDDNGKVNSADIVKLRKMI